MVSYTNALPLSGHHVLDVLPWWTHKGDSSPSGRGKMSWIKAQHNMQLICGLCGMDQYHNAPICIHSISEKAQSLILISQAWIFPATSALSRLPSQAVSCQFHYCDGKEVACKEVMVTSDQTEVGQH